MSENELLSQINKTLQSMQLQERENNEILIELRSNVKNMKEDADTYKKLVDELKTKSSENEGAMSFIKKIALFIVSMLIAFGVWVNKEIHRIDNEIIKIEYQQKGDDKNENTK